MEKKMTGFSVAELLDDSQRKLPLSLNPSLFSKLSSNDNAELCKTTILSQRYNDDMMRILTKDLQPLSTLMQRIPISRPMPISHQFNMSPIFNNNHHSQISSGTDLCNPLWGTSYRRLPLFHRFMSHEHQHQPFIFPGFRKPKRIRTAFSPSQLMRLEDAFEKNHYVVGLERKKLAASLNLTETQVKVWFQNRRTKYKRGKSEVDENDVVNVELEDSTIDNDMKESFEELENENPDSEDNQDLSKYIDKIQNMIDSRNLSAECKIGSIMPINFSLK